MRRMYVAASIIALLITIGATSSITVLAASPKSSITNSFATVDSPNVLVNPVQGPPVSQQLMTRAKSSWPWYITRAAGFVAAISLVLLMLSGIGFITGATFRFLEPLTAWATHKAIAYVFGVSVILHVVALLFDKFVSFNIAQVLVPFLSDYHPVTIAGYHLGSLYVALGVLSLYLVLAVILTSILWIDKKPHTWKLFHFLTYLTMIFVFFHVLYLGTDVTHGIFRVLWIIFGISVAVAVVYRLQRRAKA